MNASLRESQQFCRQLAKQTGKNFYYSFLTLPEPMRQEMCVLYAFMRQTDDIGDDESLSLDERRSRLCHWKQELQQSLEGEEVNATIFPALRDVVEKREIPHQYLFDVIEGVSQDLEPHRFETFGELEEYCYHVAGAVGLCCIYIWGFTGEDAKPPAIACGTAFQLTNILRDLSEDSDRGRVYLPQEDLRRFEYTEEDVRNRVIDDRFRSLMQFEVARAKEHYRQAEALMEFLSKEGRHILRAMIGIYGGLLERIESRNFDVYSSRISLSKSRKWWIVAKSLIGK
jgi:phytoene synthase